MASSLYSWLFKKQTPNNNSGINHSKEDVLKSTQEDKNSTNEKFKQIQKPAVDIIIDDNAVEGSNDICFDDDWIREEEKTLFKYTKNTIMKLINGEFASNDGYDQLYNKDSMVISVKSKGSPLNSSIALIKITYTVPLNQYPTGMTLEKFWSYISVPEKRLKWDKALKHYYIIQGIEEKGIVYKHMEKPVVMVSERDSVEKMIRFTSSKGDLYTFLSSVDDKFVSTKEGIVRITDWLSGYCISKDTGYLYIKYINQIDMKMMTPQFVLKYAMPNKLREWYNQMKIQINADH